MTFHPERYPRNWGDIRLGILWRAGNCCEQCRAPNGEGIARGVDGDAGTYMLLDGEVRDAETGATRGRARGSEYESARAITVVLTCAHVDHDESNNDPSNIRAWCQMHHLRHDSLDNRRRARANRVARSGQLTLGGVR